MKKYTALTIYAFALLILSSSCQNEESPSPVRGTVNFSLSQKKRSNGREQDAADLAYILLNIKDENGNTQENIKLPLYNLGEGYISENLELTIGHYQLNQFAVLNAANKIIYATPMEGSALAQYVTDPLPMEFVVTNEGTEVIPQVLAVSEDDQPESFGLASFRFDVVDVAIAEIPPLPNGIEEIVKVSYEFVNGSTVIADEVIPGTPLTLTLNNPELLGKTWQSTIIIWLKKDCYQKIYRFKGELVFNGAIVRLPPIETGSWTPFYYSEADYSGPVPIKILRTINPTKSYQVEVHLPQGVNGYGYVDRDLYNEAGDAICDGLYAELQNADGMRTIKVSIPDVSCELSELALADSFLFLTIGVGSQSLQIQDLFYWQVKDGIGKPNCASDNPGGRNSAIRPAAWD